MKKVNIYTQTTFKGMKKQNGAVGYVISTMTSKGECTVTDIKRIQNVTPNLAEVSVITDAMARLNQPCEVTIWTNSFYAKAGIEKWMDQWNQNNWITSKGEEVANRNEWEVLNGIISQHKVEIRVGEEHSYREWLKNEVKRAQDEK